MSPKRLVVRARPAQLLPRLLLSLEALLQVQQPHPTLALAGMHD